MTKIDALIERGAVQRVPVDPVAAERLSDDAQKHVTTATLALESGDLAGAFQLGYDAARKSLTALALSRGLRTKGEGAHAILIQLIQVEFASSQGVEVVAALDRLHRTRNRAEYSGRWFDSREVATSLETARAIVAWADRVAGEEEDEE